LRSFASESSEEGLRRGDARPVSWISAGVGAAQIAESVVEEVEKPGDFDVERGATDLA
jgi:hypothetical protein